MYKEARAPIGVNKTVALISEKFDNLKIEKVKREKFMNGVQKEIKEMSAIIHTF